jgi:hypothetical protein
MATLNEFLGSVRGEGLMRTNRFAVYFSLPAAMNTNLGSTNLRKVLLYCDQVKVPGLTFATAEAKTYGEVREMPYQRIFENIEMSFYVDNSMSVKLLFDNWLSAVINPGSRTLNYYNDYISDINISIFDINENARYTVTAFQCYPKTVSAIQMDYAGKDTMKLTVTFVSKYWQSGQVQSPVGVSQNTPSSLGGIFGQGISAIGSILGGSPQPIPNTYFTNFNSYQTGIQSFEQGRSSLFASDTASTGQGGRLF